MTLAEFILARVAEDEAAARVDQIETTTYEDLARGERTYVPGAITNVERRALAECNAKRRIIALADQHPYGSWSEENAEMGWFDLHARVLELLALPYADHPDYDGSWAV